VREFTSSEDGELFISRLEGFPSDILGRLPASAGLGPSSIEHMLVIIHPDLRADVYVNECKITARARAARPLQAGDPVTENDIIDIGDLVFQGVEAPPEAAVVCVLSAGWRKGLFFDFMPLGGDRPVREYDLWSVLGSFFAYLMNQVHRLEESQWKLLFNQGWFPFASLPKPILRQVISLVKAGLSVEPQIKNIAGAIGAMAPQMRSRWSRAALLQHHLPLLERALDRFLEEDYVSATSILYPRIEGILRSMHAASGSTLDLRPAGLAQAAVDPSMRTVHEYSWLLPRRFKDYLEQVYFASFSPGQPAPLSRHSVGHGVAQMEDFDQKHACIALLIVDQLRFLLPVEETAVALGTRPPHTGEAP